MTGKHYNWHKAWRWDGPHIAHDSGLRFEIDDILGVMTEDDSLAAFQDHELARGVPLHDIAARLKRLCREAAEFYERNPKTDR